MSYLLLLLLLPLLFLFISGNIHEGLSLGPWIWPLADLPGWSRLWSDSLYPYHNNEISVKSIGSPGTSNLYNHWKNREKHWKIEYSKDRFRTDMNHVTGLINSTLSQREINNISDIDPDYYHNPLDYCKIHPDMRPCPNFWRNNSKHNFKGIDGSFTHASGNMSKPVPALKEGVPPPTLDTQINDNYHTRVIKPEREDHALCGNNYFK